MYCPECGSEVANTAKSCSNCGKRLKNDEVFGDEQESITESNSGKDALPSDQVKAVPIKKQSTLSNVWYMLVLFALVGALAAYAIPALAGTTMPPAHTLGLMFWVGIATSVFARRKGKSGWLWFFIGFLPIAFSIMIILAILSHMFGH